MRHKRGSPAPPTRSRDANVRKGAPCLRHAPLRSAHSVAVAACPGRTAPQKRIPAAQPCLEKGSYRSTPGSAGFVGVAGLDGATGSVTPLSGFGAPFPVGRPLDTRAPGATVPVDGADGAVATGADGKATDGADATTEDAPAATAVGVPAVIAAGEAAPAPPACAAIALAMVGAKVGVVTAALSLACASAGRTAADAEARGTTFFRTKPVGTSAIAASSIPVRTAGALERGSRRDVGSDTPPAPPVLV